MSKGDDQGDFETVSPGPGPSTWPTEPDLTETPASETPSPVEPEPQLPTTGSSLILVLVVAAVLIAAGIGLLWRRRSSKRW